MPDLSLNLLRAVSGVGAATVKAFAAAGYNSLSDLQGVTPDQLTAIPGVGPATAQAILDFLSSDPAGADPVQTYRHDAKRKNIPPAGLAGQGRVAEAPPTRYFYDPHLPPVLRFDETGAEDRLPLLLEKARQEPLSADEVKLLAAALRQRQPWLEWAGKREKAWFDVDPVALHIHERVAAEAIIATARRRPLQPSLFADPELEYREAIKFYQHEMDWTNRLILGDSLTVMHSLARREDLAGKVQMIYMDPPYGIKFSSNFQTFVRSRSVSDRAKDLTREPEQIKAYRDTWTLGVHSYLAYLRDRLDISKELLSDTGSIFVQISDENLHRVRMLLDEVFGHENFINIIAVKKTGLKGSKFLDSVFDYILWYAKDYDRASYFPLLIEKQLGIGKGTGMRYDQIELLSGERKAIPQKQRRNPKSLSNLIESGARPFQLTAMISESSSDSTTFEVIYQGKNFRRTNWKTNREGFNRLIRSERIAIGDTTVRYVRYLEDFPATPIANYWDDTGLSNKIYVVQTATKVIERCILMTTKPGDIVLDPTCGSGTTAYAAEKWGRRWITIDTSRVAVALTRQRLLTAQHVYYKLQNPDKGIADGIICRSVPHVSLSSITQKPLTHSSTSGNQFWRKS
jgi:adenine-specific DNA-methyltransferase